ncbi:MAG: patatin-like phospholipase family protein [Fimbriimonadaceae bacterium]|nr:patatin-like phospholipase family protein [Fimbriimonadaceae bacterium]
MPSDQPHLGQASLSGARIWLSGALPEEEGTTDAQRASILEFVRQLARAVFQRGGHIVHGSHPSFTPVLIEEAGSYQDGGGRKDCLVLATSRYWSKDPKNFPADKFRKVAIVYEMPEASGDRARDDSLVLLRTWMASRSDAVVVVGGKWWQAVGGRAGIPLELGMAVERGLPCFLLGGLGGAAQAFVEQHPEVYQSLRNGLSPAQNRELSTATDVGSLSVRVCEQLERLPLVRGRGADGVSFRILSLDGGGLKGAFTASAIAAWEEQTGLRVVDHFDLIAGTSTGGILAIGLGLGLSGQQMLDFYRKRGPIIFPVTRLRGKMWRTARHVAVPKYSQAVLLRELEQALYAGKRPIPLRDSRCRLLIPTYHAVGGISHQFRTPHHSDLTADANTQAALAALATAAAPTYFSAAKIANMVAESSYFDGGVWANSPAMAAIVETVCFLRVPIERVDVLSVGTTEEPFTARQQTRAGIVGWLWKKRILDLLMNVQQESSLRLARHLVSDARFLRVNTVTAPGSYALDGPKEIGELIDLGRTAALKPEVLGPVKSRFLNGVKAIPWEKFGP